MFPVHIARSLQFFTVQYLLERRSITHGPTENLMANPVKENDPDKLPGQGRWNATDCTVAPYHTRRETKS